jgi:glycine betaine/choline ABC-type transport system substrate-binding protein
MDRQAFLALIALLGLVSGCSKPTVVVGSKNFTEQIVVGEIVAQLVESRLNLNVTRRLNLGGTLIAHEALVSGQIDLYPEYTGTAMTTIIKEKVVPDVRGVFDRARDVYAQQFRMTLMEPLGINNSFAMVTTDKFAAQHKLKTLSGAAGSDIKWRLGVGYEYLDRPDGYPLLRTHYPLSLAAAPRTMDLGLLFRALEDGQVDLVAANETDGALQRPGFTILEDDLKVFPPYQLCLVARTNSLNEKPGLRDALAALTGKITNEKMRQLNYEVDIKRRPAAEVAAEFLRQAGL